ncbi:hypothetical protein GCM10027447_01040 [Glycomyces halotolerans]
MSPRSTASGLISTSVRCSVTVTPKGHCRIRCAGLRLRGHAGRNLRAVARPRVGAILSDVVPIAAAT